MFAGVPPSLHRLRLLTFFPSPYHLRSLKKRCRYEIWAPGCYHTPLLPSGPLHDTTRQDIRHFICLPSSSRWSRIHRSSPSPPACLFHGPPVAPRLTLCNGCAAVRRLPTSSPPSTLNASPPPLSRPNHCPLDSLHLPARVDRYVGLDALVQP